MYAGLAAQAQRLECQVGLLRPAQGLGRAAGGIARQNGVKEVGNGWACGPPGPEAGARIWARSYIPSAARAAPIWALEVALLILATACYLAYSSLE